MSKTYWFVKSVFLLLLLSQFWVLGRTNLKTIQFSSVSQLRPILCNPMDCSTPGFPIHHQLPELTQTHVHWVGGAMQPANPLSSPAPVEYSCSVVSDSLWPQDCSMSDFPVHHQFSELTQTHVHWVGDAIQPSHPLSSPSPAFNLSQHQGLFQWVSSPHQMAKELKLQ